ncbi:MAG: adenosine kinase [Treponema sp.]|nr:adenosine kinase [Treponema sp.]
MELVGIGNALLDVISFVDSDYPPYLGVHNLTTNHVPYDRMEDLLLAVPEPIFVAGGGAANTIRVAALLGLRGRFVGAVGRDRFADLFRRDMEEAGAEFLAVEKNHPTGIFLALVGEDGSRAIVVSPGAAGELSIPEIPERTFVPGAILYVDGFVASRRELFIHILERGRSAGMRVAVDAASFSLANRNAAFFLDAFEEYCEWVFVNEDELRALAGLPLDEALSLFAASRFELIVKRAERGAIWSYGDRRIDSPVRALTPMDETGAGDAFAAGFLAAVLEGKPPEVCLRMGNRVAEEIIQVPGCRLDPGRIRRARQSVLV